MASSCFARRNQRITKAQRRERLPPNPSVLARRHDLSKLLVLADVHSRDCDNYWVRGSTTLSLG